MSMSDTEDGLAGVGDFAPIEQDTVPIMRAAQCAGLEEMVAFSTTQAKFHATEMKRWQKIANAQQKALDTLHETPAE